MILNLHNKGLQCCHKKIVYQINLKELKEAHSYITKKEREKHNYKKI